VVRRRVTGKKSSPPGWQDVAPVTLASKCAPAVVASVGRKQWALRTLVINLDRRKDRWRGVQSRLKAPQVSGLLAVERFVATDGQCEGAVPDDVVSRRWTTDHNAKYDGRQGYRAGVELEMSPGERACAMSHVRAWREVLSVAGGGSDPGGGGDGVGEPVLVLEDDAVLAADFAKRLRPAVEAAAAAGADALYLGYIQGAPWRRCVSKGLQEAEYLWTTVGYILWPRGARRLLGALPVDAPVDNFMAWLCASGRLRSLAVEPELVDQEGEWDFGSDVPHSDDVVLEL